MASHNNDNDNNNSQQYKEKDPKENAALVYHARGIFILNPDSQNQ